MQDSRIFEYINITNVLNQLHLKKIYSKGNNIYAICPFCQKSDEKNGHLKIDVIKNVYICKNCEESGSSLDLYAKCNFISTKDAMKKLLKEVPVLDNIPYTYNNPIKDEYYRDIVYRSFLNLLKLNENHRVRLKKLNFSDKFIDNNLFKSMENNINKKKEICLKLQEQGLKLDGISGFYQDTDFKWSYKSHNGILVPVVLDDKIQGLRILLDKEYGLDTENIWFSSNNEYNGTKAYNWPMVLKNEKMNWFDMYNSKNKIEVIIATEMILAYKLFNNTNKVVIGIPNNIDKDVILNIVKRINASKVVLYVDRYTILHTSTLIFKNIIKSLENKGIKVDFRIALIENNIGSDLNNNIMDNKKVS